MNPCRLFISQSALDQWTSEGRATLNDNQLHDRHTHAKYTLREGLRFISEVSGARDLHTLVGKVKDLDQLAALEAEVMADSVLLGDNAYQVQPGFVGTLIQDSPRETPRGPANETLEALQKLILGQIS